MKRFFKIAACLLFFVAGTVIFYHSYSTAHKNVQEVLATLPAKDCETLCDFFEELVNTHGFGYTLFGDKPVSSAGYFIRPLLSDILLEDKTGVLLRNGEFIWKKHRKLFNLKKFTLSFYVDKDVSSVYLINKDALAKQVRENIDYFREVLGPNVSAQSFLKKSEHQDIFSLCNNHEGLIGICFGYGTQNAKDFHRYSELDKYLYEVPPIPHKPLYEEDELVMTNAQKLSLWLNRQAQKHTTKSIRKITPSPGFKNVLEEYNYLQAKLKGSEGTLALQQVITPGFRQDPKLEETKNLLTSFKNTRTLIHEYYAKRDFLEGTLAKLSGE